MSALDWSVLVTAAVLVGFAKTAIGGIGAVATALFAAVLPARESTGALLPLLLAGDLVAVGAYRKHADWPVLVRLFPSVAAGVVLGAGFVARADDAVMRRAIGVLLVALVTLTVVQRVRKRSIEVRGRLAAAAFGSMAGFATMVANAAGPVMAIYLLAAGASVLGYLGTARGSSCWSTCSSCRSASRWASSTPARCAPTRCCCRRSWPARSSAGW